MSESQSALLTEEMNASDSEDQDIKIDPLEVLGEFSDNMDEEISLPGNEESVHVSESGENSFTEDPNSEAKEGKFAPKHQCAFCGKDFKKLWYLQRHMSVHISKDEFLSCLHCTKKFPFKESLILHYKRKHPFDHYFIDDEDEEEPDDTSEEFRCGHCHEIFHDMGQLKRHMLKHVGPKDSYNCFDCPKMYLSRRALLRHQKREHPWRVTPRRFKSRPPPQPNPV